MRSQGRRVAVSAAVGLALAVGAIPAFGVQPLPVPIPSTSIDTGGVIAPKPSQPEPLSLPGQWRDVRVGTTGFGGTVVIHLGTGENIRLLSPMLL